MPSLFPQMPQFREPNGSIDWRQMADMVLPGNWYNSRSNEWRPLGIAQGLTGIPVDTLAQIGQEIGPAARSGANWLGSRLGRFGSNPSMLGPIALGGKPRQPTVDAFGNRLDDIGVSREASSRGGSWQMTGTRGGSRNEASRNLGAGVLGSAGDAATAYYQNAIRSRGGALMEM